jgi:cellulose synthase/poly-beta-1,6-N-acetylglucosamine synthase-like glycosyltransferase
MTFYWISVAFLVVLNLALLPYFLYLLVVSLAAVCARPEKLSGKEPRSKFLIVIPAKDEESTIADTVRSCLASNYPEPLYSVMVIADNCSDATTSLAAEAGANVIERFDPDKKSKGYAIEYLIEVLAPYGTLDSTHALVLVDADTSIDPDLLRYFDQDLRAGRDWIQCYYSVADPERSWRTRLMTYAFSLYNGVVPMGQYALGSSATLRGNGMCFSTRGMKRRPWRSYGLVEDMDYSWSLRIAGERIAFQPRATVRAAIPSEGGNAAATQRRRWEFGRGETRKKYFLPLLKTDHMGLWQKVLSLCELTIPSIVWLVLMYLVAVVLDVNAFFSPANLLSPPSRWLLLSSGAILTISLCVHAISPFVALSLPTRYISSLAFFPVYLCWKLLISLGGRPKEWVRTARESH